MKTFELVKFSLTLSNNVFIMRNSFIINDLGAGASRRAVTR